MPSSRAAVISRMFRFVLLAIFPPLAIRSLGQGGNIIAHRAVDTNKNLNPDRKTLKRGFFAVLRMMLAVMLKSFHKADADRRAGGGDVGVGDDLESAKFERLLFAAYMMTDNPAQHRTKQDIARPVVA